MDERDWKLTEQEHSGYPRRLNYFVGMLLGAAEFAAEQDYFREKLKRHNRHLHGSGIAAGLEVSISGGQINVAPGLALDCAGNEIVVPRALFIELPDAATSLYVAVRYGERLTSAVPPPGVAEETTLYAYIEEIAQLSYEPANPFVKHRRAGKSYRACGAAHPVPLCRLKRAGARWLVDRRFRPPRIQS